MVRGACVIQDKGRAFGRCGTGSVMGSKNLKAIVARGTGALRVARPKEFKETVARIRGMFKDLKRPELMQKYGTVSGLRAKQDICGANWKNFQEVTVRKRCWRSSIPPSSSISLRSPARAFRMHVRLRPPSARHGGALRGLETEAPQMETLLTLQTRLAVEEPTFLLKAHAYCNQMGLDLDAAGGPIGWAMECYQRVS